MNTADQRAVDEYNDFLERMTRRIDNAGIVLSAALAEAPEVGEDDSFDLTDLHHEHTEPKQ